MKEFTKVVIDSLNGMKDKNLPWIKPWREIDTCYKNMFSNRPYTGLHNILTCALSDFTDPRYATFNQIKKAGGKLKKDSKSTRLIAWKFGKIKQDDGTEKIIPFATSWCLFNVEQTEGLNLPEINTDVIDEMIFTNPDILRIYDDLKVDFSCKKCNSAHYDPRTDHIQIPHIQQFKSTDMFYGTFLHELIHWCAKRVNQDISKYNFDIEFQSLEELVAELGSMYLSMNLKINGYMDKQNLAYIKSWQTAACGKNGNRLIYKACKLAEERCKYIMENANIFQSNNHMLCMQEN